MNITKVKLSDICIGKGNYGIPASAVPFSEDLYTYLRITDINDDGTLNLADKKSVNDPKAKNYILKENDIVFARTGNSTGRSYFYDSRDGELVYAGFLIKFSLDPQKVNPLFIKYYAISEAYRGWIASFNTGSTRGNINAQTYANMEIPLPSRSQQDLTVDILSSLDSKIRWNTQINHNLEEQAKAIFKSWFVDFEPFQNGKFVDSELGKIPEGWRVGTLNEIADITMGQSPQGASYNENAVGTVFYQGRAEFTDRFPSRRLFTTEPKRMANAGDVLLSVRAPVGDLNIANEPCCIGRGLAAIHAKNGFASFIFYTMQALKTELEKYNGEGTVFGCINKDSLSSQKVIIPPRNIIADFESIASSLDCQYFVDFNENIHLAQLRDTLLPKLMSGEIDVSEVEI